MSVQIRMRILISGASGFVGENLRRTLQDAGHQVWHLVRRQTESEQERRWDIRSGVIDLRVDDAFDAVIHLAGASIADRRWSKSVKQELLESRILSTTLLAQTIADMKTPPKTFISASAIGIYGAQPEGPVTETSPHGDDFLAELCERWEDSAQVAKDAGIRVVHPRLSVVLGRGGGMLQRVMPLFENRFGGRLGNGAQWFSWIALSDLLRGFLFILDTPSIVGPVNMSAPNCVTNQAFTKALQQVLSVSCGIPAPAAALKLAFGREMAEQTMLASQRVIPEVLVNAGFVFEFGALEDALAHELAALQTR